MSPNCRSYNSNGMCTICEDNFVLRNGVCVSQPVGIVMGTTSTCRSGYYLNNGNCYRNANDLRLFSTTVSSAPRSLASIAGAAAGLNTNIFTARSNGDPLIIFGITVTTTAQTIPPGSEFILYYRSKVNDPFICWNSCLPTAITQHSFIKDLVFPIIAVEVQIYLLNMSLVDGKVDLKVL